MDLIDFPMLFVSMGLVEFPNLFGHNGSWQSRTARVGWERLGPNQKHRGINRIHAGRDLWVTSRENYLSCLSHPTAALNKMRWCVKDPPSVT